MIGALIGICLALGIVLVVAGFTPADPAAPRGPRRTRRKKAAGSGLLSLTRQETIAAGAALAVGVVVAALFGWIVMILIAPAAAVGGMRLVRPNKGVDPDELEALEEWVRALRGILSSNASMATAIVQTLPSTPTAIRPQVERLVARLRGNAPLEASLYSFAEELDSQTGDYIAASLIQAAQFSGAGLSAALEAIAAEVAVEVRARREIEVDRAKPLTESRWISIITIASVIVLVFLTPFGSVYRDTALGQTVLLALSCLFAAVLYWLRQRASTTPSPRFLSRPQEGSR
ncbi:type II secretion system F family protein [Janibacter sp. LM]|uniref:TadB-like protein n=1 Tax=Terrabacter sp. (strain DBF63) TaxID=150395 RepID=Q3MNR4_TERSD|nr:TadB-like protein [Terrabacter sp. DBF63]